MNNINSLLNWTHPNAGLFQALAGMGFLTAFLITVIIIVAREPRKYWGLGLLFSLYLFIVFAGADSALNRIIDNRREPTSMMPFFRTTLASIIMICIAYFNANFRNRQKMHDNGRSEGGELL